MRDARTRFEARQRREASDRDERRRDEREALLSEITAMARDFAGAPEQIGFFVADLEAHGLVDGASKEEIAWRLEALAGADFARAALAPSLAGPTPAELARALRREYEAMVAHRGDGEGDLAARVEGEVRRLEAEVGLAHGTVDVRLGEEAERKTQAAGTRGLAEGRTVWVQARAADPRTADGRGLLGHEVTHVAQRSLPGVAAVDAAELEAAAMARRAALGQPLERPRVALGVGMAAERGAERAAGRAKPWGPHDLRMELVVWKVCRDIRLTEADRKLCTNEETHAVTAFVRDTMAGKWDFTQYLQDLVIRAEHHPRAVDEAWREYQGRIIPRVATHLTWLTHFIPHLEPDQVRLVRQASAAIQAHLDRAEKAREADWKAKVAPLLGLTMWDDLDGAARQQLAELYLSNRIRESAWQRVLALVDGDAAKAEVEAMFKDAFHFERQQAATEDPVIATRGHHTYRLRGKGKEVVLKRDLDDARRGIETMGRISAHITQFFLAGIAAGPLAFAKGPGLVAFGAAGTAASLRCVNEVIKDPGAKKTFVVLASVLDLVGAALSLHDSLKNVNAEMWRGAWSAIKTTAGALKGVAETQLAAKQLAQALRGEDPSILRVFGREGDAELDQALSGIISVVNALASSKR